MLAQPPRSIARSGRQSFAHALAAFAMTASLAHAQLAPSRTYIGLSRPITMTVTVPDAAKGEPEIDLVDPKTSAVVHTSPAVAGPVDLAGLFPVLWTSAEPTMLYAQLRIGPKPIGAPVVLQPLLNPARAALDEREPRLPLVVWPTERQPKRVYSGLRTYPLQDAVLKTDLGEIRIALRPDLAPNTAWNFRTLVAGGFYDGSPFHRVIAVGSIAGEPFLIQAGDPTGEGEGGPGYEIAMENSPLKHDFGVVGMARQRDPNSAGSQFYIALSRTESARLDGQYCAFGQVLSGMDIALKIARSPIASGASDRPAKPPKITSATMVDSAPIGEAPKPQRPPGADR